MIRNLRDLSIYRNKNDKRLRKGEFIRSAALVELTESDIAMLTSFDELTVIDLIGLVIILFLKLLVYYNVTRGLRYKRIHWII